MILPGIPPIVHPWVFTQSPLGFFSRDPFRNSSWDAFQWSSRDVFLEVYRNLFRNLSQSSMEISSSILPEVPLKNSSEILSLFRKSSRNYLDDSFYGFFPRFGLKFLKGFFLRLSRSSNKDSIWDFSRKSFRIFSRGLWSSWHLSQYSSTNFSRDGWLSSSVFFSRDSSFHQRFLQGLFQDSNRNSFKDFSWNFFRGLPQVFFRESFGIPTEIPPERFLSGLL